MDTASNKDNLEPLKTQCEALEKGHIRIASGWIRSEYLKKVLTGPVQERIRRGDVGLSVLFRIGDPQDVKITDPGVLYLLENLASSEKSDVQWRYSPHHHAKLYLVGDTWGMVGSFNLTGGGFGNDSRPGSNPEAGIITTAKGDLKKLQARFEEMWEEADKLEDRLMGFVANPSSTELLQIIGTRPVAAGTFVEVPLDDGYTLLAKVEKSYRYNANFFHVDSSGMPDPNLFRYFTGSNYRMNQVNGIALAGDNRKYQLHLSEVKPLNKFRGAGSGITFEPAAIPPAVSAPVYSADPCMLSSFFNPAEAGYAVLEENPDVAVSFLDDEILTKHFAVLGSTGSGKSYFVKQYLRHRLCPLAQGGGVRVVIIDTHGEYGPDTQFGSCGVTEILPGPEAARAAGAVHLEDLEDIKEQVGTPGRREKEILQAAFDTANRAAKKDRQEAFLKHLRGSITAGEAEPDWDSVLLNLVDCLPAAEAEKPKNNALGNKLWNYREQRDFIETLGDKKQKEILLTRLKRDIIADLKKTFPADDSASRFLSVLTEKIEAGEYRLNTLNLIRTLDRPGIYRLNLHGIDDPDIRRSVVGDLLQETFEKGKEARGAFKTIFVIDEAQNYAPEPASKKIPSYRWMKVIASEGRKFNIALLVMTQRPQYLSKDILTQCNTQAIFRLVNKADLAQVENTVEGISEYDLARLPNFVAGQAIFTGIGMKMPVRVRVKEVHND